MPRKKKADPDDDSRLSAAGGVDMLKQWPKEARKKKRPPFDVTAIASKDQSRAAQEWVDSSQTPPPPGPLPVPGHIARIDHDAENGAEIRAIPGDLVYPARPGYPIEWRYDEHKSLTPWFRNPQSNELTQAIWAAQYGSQYAFLQATSIYEVLYSGTRGPGKGLPVKTPVWTPAGPRPIGEIRVGDVVCTPGGYSTVTGVFPQGVRPCFTVFFSDGAHVTCDDQHRWTVVSRAGKQRLHSVIDMERLSRRLAFNEEIEIPLSGPIRTDEAMYYSEEFAEFMGELFAKGTIPFRDSPDHFLRFHTNSRYAFLRGIMKRCSITSTGEWLLDAEEQLLLAARELAWSCGYMAQRESGILRMWLPRFEDARKIVGIVECEPQETVCISIADQDGMFITQNSVVTHNTDSLLMDFAQHTGKGFGQDWRGVLFRQTYPQLSDVISKTQKWFPLLFRGIQYNRADHTWTWPGGEQLLLRHMKSPDDYWAYHGHSYSWIGWEELTNWPDDKCYMVMMSCSRSTRPGVPRCYRSTTNPYGNGHNWVRGRWRLPQMFGKVIRDSWRNGALEPPRVAIHGHLQENKILLNADPEYIQKLRSAARNPSELAAWVNGDWDILAGGMFDDVWRSEHHIVSSFPLHLLPRGWKIDRAFDWGSAKPFAVGWFAESNGEPFRAPNGRLLGRMVGDTYMIAEWYGWNGTRNEGCRMLARDIARGIRDREDDWGILGRCQAGPADSSIFDVDNGRSIAEDMSAEGVYWLPADKGSGSRKQGWQQMRKSLAGAVPAPGGGPREFPGLFVFDSCHQTIELLPVTPRSDKDLDDVDTDFEDHIADMMRYRVRKKLRGATQTEM